MAALFAAWCALVVHYTLPSFLWQVEYYKNPGPGFYQAFLIAAPLTAALAGFYAWVRRRGLWRYEPAALAAIPLVAAFFYEPLGALACLLIVTASYVAGRRLLAALELEPSNTLEDFTLSIGAGFSLFVLLLFGLGVAGLYRPWMFWLLALATPALDLQRLREIPSVLRGMQRTWSTNESLRSPLVGAAVFFSAIFIVCGMGVIIAPMVAFDPMNYHIALAEQYVGEGVLQAAVDPFYASHPQASELRSTWAYAFYPQAFELLSTWAYGTGGLPATQFLAPVFFLLALALCAHIGLQCGWSAPAVALGIAASATMPFIHWTGSVVKNDLAMAFFQLAALACFLGWLRDERFNWIRLGALFLAMSFGVKHTAVFGAAPLAALGVYAGLRQKHPLRALASVALILVFTGAFWHLRTYLITGSPTFPQGSERALDAFELDDAGAAINNLWRYPRILWRAHLDGPALFEAIIPGPVGIYLALFTLPALLSLRRGLNPSTRAVAFFVFTALLYWMSLMGTLRYAIAPIMLCPLLVSPSLIALHDGLGKALRPLVVVPLIYSFVFAWSGIMIIENNGPQIAYLLGRIDESAYLKVALGPYGVIEAVGKEAAPGDEILSIQACAAVYAPESWRFHCKFLTRREELVDQMSRLLAERPYRFFIVQERYVDEVQTMGLNLEELYEGAGYVAYRLGPR